LRSSKRKSLKLNLFFLSASAMIVAASVMTGLTLNTYGSQQARDTAQLEAITVSQNLADRIERYFGQIEVTSLSLSVIVANNPDMSQEAYDEVAERLISALPEVINVAAAPDNIVRFVHPEEPNRSVIGLDYRRDPSVMAIMDRARHTRRPQLEGPVNLVQGGEGFIARTPVYVAGANTNTERYWGALALVFRTDGLFEAIDLLRDEDRWQIGISRVDAETDLGRLVYGSVSRRSPNAVRREVSGLGLEWEVAVMPAGGEWPTIAPAAGATWTILAGTAGFLILVLHTFLSLFRSREIAQTRLEQAIESLQDGFALYDEDDRLVLCNEKYKQTYLAPEAGIAPGVQFEDLVRSGVARGLYPAAEGREEAWIQERLRVHEEASAEFEELLSDGRWLKISERETPDGSTVGLRVDITELKTSIARAEEANRAKSEFLQVISHELRTPLTAVIGFLSFLAKPELLPAARKMAIALADETTPREDLVRLNGEQLKSLSDFATRAQVSSDHLLRLIGDVLVWSKLERHEVMLDMQPITTLDLVDRLKAQVEELARARKVDLSIRADEVGLTADPDRLTQALLNLLSNAIKFAEKGKVMLRVEQTDKALLFRVLDSGPGIPEHLQEKIFERFYQADTSKTRAHGGIGLGLSIARHLVELHGGRLTVYSEPGKGSEFTIALPRKQKLRRAA